MLRAAVVILAVLAVCQGLPRRQQHRLPNRDGIDTKIVGGHNVDITDFSFQVSVRYWGDHTCSGTILTTTFILTAGHCVDALTTVDEATIRAGSTSIVRGGQLDSVVWATMHPKYSYDTLAYDVGVLQLRRPLLLGPTRSIVRLVAANAEPQAGSKLTLSGWGTLDVDEYGLSENLMAVQVPLVARSKCAQAFSDDEYLLVDETMICAGELGKDNCQHDSGNPLVDSKKTQVGLTSWGIDCGTTEKPGVYVNLAHPDIRSWIVETSGYVE